MPDHVDDQALLAEIDQLAAREDELHARAQEDDGLSAEDQLALEQVRVERDQAWDLLRQRRAKREAGQDPDEAERRSGSVVETYEQ